MSVQEEEAIGVVEVPLEQIESLWFNPNSMEDEKFEALKEDMRQGGQDSISPIILVEKSSAQAFPGAMDITKRYVCADGNHRLQAARALKWKTVRAIVDHSISDERQLRVANFKKNVERGQTDPFKEAQLFKWMMDTQHLSQQQIADQCHVGDRSQVSKRLSLLKIDPEVLKSLEGVPGVTPSQLEIIAPQDPAVQKKIVEEVKRSIKFNSSFALTEKNIREKTEEAKDWKENNDKLLDALEEPENKFQKCPGCGAIPDSISWMGLPWVTCRNWHAAWSLKTGKTKEEYKTSSAERQSQKKPPVPSFIRTEYTIDDFSAAFSEAAKEAVSRFSMISDISVRGEAGGKVAKAFLRSMSGRVQFDMEVRDEKINISVEEKKYGQEDLKNFKTSVSRFPQPKTQKALDQLQQEVEFLFAKPRKMEKLSKEEIEALKDLKQRVGKFEHFRPNKSQLDALEKLIELGGV